MIENKVLHSSRQRFFTIFLLFFIVLLFTKIDFRLKTDITCCSDDFDYFIHAETIVEDFDFEKIANSLEKLYRKISL